MDMMDVEIEFKTGSTISEPIKLQIDAKATWSQISASIKKMGRMSHHQKVRISIRDKWSKWLDCYEPKM